MPSIAERMAALQAKEIEAPKRDAPKPGRRIGGNYGDSSQASAFDGQVPLMSGFLKKAGVGAMSATYSKRWCAIYQEPALQLAFFEDESLGTPKGSFTMVAGSDSTTVHVDGGELTLETVMMTGRTSKNVMQAKLQAESIEQAREWARHLQACIDGKSLPPNNPNGIGGSGGGASSGADSAPAQETEAEAEARRTAEAEAVAAAAAAAEAKMEAAAAARREEAAKAEAAEAAAKAEKEAARVARLGTPEVAASATAADVDETRDASQRKHTAASAAVMGGKAAGLADGEASLAAAAASAVLSKRASMESLEGAPAEAEPANEQEAAAGAD
jgi:hypothetical protein